MHLRKASHPASPLSERDHVAQATETRYSRAHAFLTPHLSVALHLQPAGGAEAAPCALNKIPPFVIKQAASRAMPR